MAPVEETPTASTIDQDGKRFSSPAGDQRVHAPGMHCGGCHLTCPIPPFDDLLSYGVHCHSKPEDLHPEQWFNEPNLWQWQRGN